VDCADEIELNHQEAKDAKKKTQTNSSPPSLRSSFPILASLAPWRFVLFDPSGKTGAFLKN
jgi:hypothetical protein